MGTIQVLDYRDNPYKLEAVVVDEGECWHAADPQMVEMHAFVLDYYGDRFTQNLLDTIIPRFGFMSVQPHPRGNPTNFRRVQIFIGAQYNIHDFREMLNKLYTKANRREPWLNDFAHYCQANGVDLSREYNLFTEVPLEGQQEQQDQEDGNGL